MSNEIKPTENSRTAIETIKKGYLDTQTMIFETLLALDGQAQSIQDDWQRAEGGGGISRVLAEGAVFEKGGVNFSHVMGQSLPPSATQLRPDLAGAAFEALGVSLVMHPRNPYVPTSHLNIRYFEVKPKEASPVGWFGGGYDLTPYYGFTEDCVVWHQGAKAVCDAYDEQYYPKFKQWCDDYFFLKHRGEPRGIGGIFFDDLVDESPVDNLQKSDSSKNLFHFTLEVAKAYLTSYTEIVKRRHQMPYGQRQRDFQLYRRGRYVEFNLVFDRGTLFGLQSGGRTESILMSLPPEVRWRYDWQPEAGSPEAELTTQFLVPREWV